MTNQKPDKCLWCSGISTHKDWCPTHEVNNMELKDSDTKVREDKPQSDTTLRDEIQLVLEEYGEFVRRGDHSMTDKAINKVKLPHSVDAILDTIAKRLPEEKTPSETMPYRSVRQEQRDIGYNLALSEVRAIIEGRDGR